MATTDPEGWYIDGVALAEHAQVEDYGGWDDTPAVRGDDVTLLGRHGDLWRRKRYGPGRKALRMVVVGTGPDGQIPHAGTAQRAAYESHLDEVLRLLAPRHRPLEVVRVYADGTRRVAQCDVVTAIAPEPIGLCAGRITVELSIPGAFWADVDATTYRMPLTTTTGPQVVEAFGLSGQTAPCQDAVVAVTGPVVGVSVHDSLTGSGWSWPGTLVPGQVLVVDSGDWSATVDGASVLPDIAMQGQVLLEVSPAPSASRGPDLVVQWGGATTSSSMTVTTRRRWVR